MSVRIYVASGCRHCAALIADLERRNVAFVCINLSESPEQIGEVISATYERRLPVAARIAHRSSAVRADFAALAGVLGVRRVPPYCPVRLPSSPLRAPAIIGISARSSRAPVRNAGQSTTSAARLVLPELAVRSANLA